MLVEIMAFLTSSFSMVSACVCGHELIAAYMLQMAALVFGRNHQDCLIVVLLYWQIVELLVVGYVCWMWSLCLEMNKCVGAYVIYLYRK